MSSTGRFATLMSFVTAALAAGCVQQHLAIVDGVAEGQPREGWRASLLADYKAHVERCETASAAPAAGEYSMLLLTGGGSWGAWGAGFLAGWTESPHPPPSFRVVTGLSTGAIMATSVFLAGQSDRDVLRACYTHSNNEDIWEPRPFWELPWASSLRSARPLADLMDRELTPALIDRVAAEGRKGRRLLVGTADLDGGEAKVWDLTAVALSSHPDRYRQYRALVVASAAIPGLFEPVSIDGHLNVDGGMAARLLPDSALFEQMAEAAAPAAARLKQRLATLEAAGDTAEAARTRARLAALGPAVNVVINAQLEVKPQVTKASALSLLKRSLVLVLFTGKIAELRQMAALFRRNDWEGFRTSSIPRTVSLDGHRPEQFSPVPMQRLFDLGFQRGKEEAWDRL